MVTIVCDLSTPVTWPVGANEDGVCAVMLGGTDGKAYSSSWQLDSRSPLEKGECCLLYMYAHIQLRKMACEHRYMKKKWNRYMYEYDTRLISVFIYEY